MITRTFKNFTATARYFGKNGEIVNAEPITVLATSCKEGEVRKAYKAKGIKIPRNSYIHIVEGEEIKMGCTIEEFMSIAHVIDSSAIVEED